MCRDSGFIRERNRADRADARAGRTSQSYANRSTGPAAITQSAEECSQANAAAFARYDG